VLEYRRWYWNTNERHTHSWKKIVRPALDKPTLLALMIASRRSVAMAGDHAVSIMGTESQDLTGRVLSISCLGAQDVQDVSSVCDECGFASSLGGEGGLRD
jgi:hypothetical protein